MSMAIKVKMLLTAKEMTMEDLAKKMNPPVTRQSMSAKLKRDNLSERDLREIAAVCGVSFEGSFLFEDGRKI